MDVAMNMHEYGDMHLDIFTLDTQGITVREDALAIEEALEIRLAGPSQLSLCERQATTGN
ncbi:hypothetical protein HSBAA_03840 [Vreelandella sulfidaeris]|uniref:Uncharacterized protein n=1 Tax=Vreelandella sulfidaeris TaxID=115553 RepID=A0A455U3K1_9GAMM|nr:hypothetical protein HSBAA_03840 [Halomonas sulfidaeris]